MKFLLLDFGASFVKASIYDNELKELSSLKQYQSPFSTSDKINLEILKDYLSKIIHDFESFDIALSCSIKNGCLVDGEYVSWKLLNQSVPYEKESVIGSIFKNQKNYHIHQDHDETSSVINLKKLGFFNNKLFLSCLGDTDCVKRAFNIDEKSVLINLGTGAQMIYKNDIKSFFPSGRMFLAFEMFFESMGCNFFDDLGKIKLEDIILSSLEIDINIFSQAINFSNYGTIKNINEHNLSKTNLLSSLLKSYIEQFTSEIHSDEIDTIFLAGGIAKKLPVIEEYIKYKLNIEVKKANSSFPDTHHGMVNMIEKFYQNY